MGDLMCIIPLPPCVFYRTGVFNMFFIQEYQHESKAIIASCGVLIPSLTTLAGPLASSLVAILGARKTLLLGATLAYCGLSLTFFAKTFMHIFITFGIMSGAGLGICYATSLYILGIYFKKYRNIAFGIVLSAFGIGMMAFPPFLDVLYENYSVKGTILIIGGISAHLFIVAILTIPISERQCVDESINEDLIVEVSKLASNPNSELVYKPICDKNCNNHNEYGHDVVLKTDLKDKNMNEKYKWNTNMNKTDCKERSSLKNTIYENNDDNCLELKYPLQEEDKVNNINQPSRNSQLCMNRTCGKLFEVKFMLYCSYILIIHIGLSSIRLHFPAYAFQQGTNMELASVLITVFGIGNTIARLSIGCITHNKAVLMYIFNILTGILATIVIFFGPYIGKTYTGQILFSFFFSLLGNGFQPIIAPIAIDIVGIERFNVVNGIILMMGGIGILVGPIISGYIYDVTLTYFYTFIMAGVSYGVSSVLMCVIVGVKIYQEQ